uniref:Uncharacterized protein n=1 Tax=Rhodothermus marinus TaxID=29549 RepID=A0A7V2AZX2_RHOMR
MIPVEYIRIDRSGLDAPDVQQALEAGRAVLVHESSRYVYLKAIAPAGFGEVLGASLDELSSQVRRYFMRRYVRRRITVEQEDGSKQEEVLDLLVAAGEEQEGDEVLGDYEAAKFAGE